MFRLKKMKRCLAIFLFAIILCGALSSNASAYVKNGYVLSSPTYVGIYSYNTTYASKIYTYEKNGINVLSCTFTNQILQLQQLLLSFPVPTMEPMVSRIIMVMIHILLSFTVCGKRQPMLRKMKQLCMNLGMRLVSHIHKLEMRAYQL